jgi:hypothetical protein
MIWKSAVTNTITQSLGSLRTIDSLGPSRDESVSSRSCRKVRIANDTTDFVFVDETNHSPQFKALKRYKICSQARSRAALFKKKCETGWRTKSTGLRPLRPLAPQGRGHSGSQFLPHNKSCALTIRKRRTFADSDGKPLNHRQNLELFC